MSNRAALTSIFVVSFLAVWLGPTGFLSSAAAAKVASSSTQGATTFGRTTIGSMSALGDGRKRASRFWLDDAGSVTHLSAFLDGKGSGTGTGQAVRFVLYRDDSGSPRGLLASTGAHSVAKGSAAAWVTRALPSPLSLARGFYHLGIHSGPKKGVARAGTVSLSDGIRENGDSFANGASNPFGTTRTANVGLSVYATYTPATTAPSVDTQRPSVPQGLTMTGATEGSITLAWNGSTDNVGVAGYRMFRNENAIATTAQTSYTFSGLACGTSYTLALEAYDNAGNVSNNEEATTIRATSACATSAPRLEAAATVFASIGGSDANSCTQTAPCATLNRAYRVAQPGDVVEVSAGFYPTQTIVLDTSKTATSAMVVIRPAAGAAVILYGLRLGSNASANDGPRSVTVKGMRIADANGKQRQVAAFNSVNNIVLEDLDAANFYLEGVKNFTIRGGDWGPCLTTSTGTYSNESADGCSKSMINGNPNNENITIEDAVFHDYRITPGSGAHFECMFVVNGTNITIRRNKFVNCEFYNIFFQNFSQNGPVTGVTVENNWFDTPWNGNGAQNRPTGVAFSPRGRAFTNILVRYNSFFETGIAVNDDGDGTPYSNFRVVGNIASRHWAGCYPFAVYRHNVWAGSTCDATDRSLPGGVFPYVTPVRGAVGDYHLTGGVALDLVKDTTVDASVESDIDKQARPRGAGRDAGSHEAG